MVLGSSIVINGKNLGCYLNDTLFYKDGEIEVSIASQWWNRHQIPITWPLFQYFPLALGEGSQATWERMGGAALPDVIIPAWRGL